MVLEEVDEKIEFNFVPYKVESIKKNSRLYLVI